MKKYIILSIALMCLFINTSVLAVKVCPDGYRYVDATTCGNFEGTFRLDVVGIDESEILKRYINGTRTRENLLVDTSWVTVNSSNIDDILNTPKVDENIKVYDFANLMTNSEEEYLKTQIDTFIERTGYDCIVLTTLNNNKYSEMEYADDFFDYNNFQHSGILFLIDMDNRKVYISTGGACQDKYNPYIDTIIDAGYSDLKNGDYFSSFTKMIDTSQGIYLNPSNYRISNGNSSMTSEQRLKLFLGLDLCVCIIVFTVIYFTNRLKIKAVNIASYYLLPTSHINFNHVFRNMTVSKVRINTDSGSSGIGGGSHFSGGGISHGGGGRSF